MKLYSLLFEAIKAKQVSKFLDSDVELEGDAHIEDGAIVLTNDYHQNGSATVTTPVTLEGRSWKAEIIFQIDNSEGVEDAEGSGGDGISLVFTSPEGLTQDGLVISFDTYKNLENNSGNEIVLRVENSVVEKKYVHRKMNDGKPHHFRIHYNDMEQVLSVHELVDGETLSQSKPILAYAFSEYPLVELLPGECFIKFTSFTGDAKGTHKVLAFDLEYVD